jgi:hypothetical protein
MVVHRVSLLTGKPHQMDLPVTSAELEAWSNGGKVQDIFPGLNVDEREFIISGITPEEWLQAFGKEE